MTDTEKQAVRVYATKACSEIAGTDLTDNIQVNDAMFVEGYRMARRQYIALLNNLFKQVCGEEL